MASLSVCTFKQSIWRVETSSFAYEVRTVLFGISLVLIWLLITVIPPIQNLMYFGRADLADRPRPSFLKRLSGQSLLEQCLQPRFRSENLREIGKREPQQY